jgi:hypothetical protein
MLNTIKKLLAEYPAVLAAVLNFAVLALGKYGFHVSEDQLIAWAAVGYTVLAALLHGGMKAARKRL